MTLSENPSFGRSFPRAEPAGPTSIGSVLASVGITKRKLKKLDAIVHARDPDARPQRAFSARPFVLCGIPIRRPAKHTLEYLRQNGKFRLRVIGHPDYGLPFGQDRLLLIWIASMATWHKDRVIRFRSAANILDAFQLPKDGRYYKRLITGFERIFYATFYFASDEQHAEAVVITRTSFRFVKDLRLWHFHSDDACSNCEGVPRQNVIVLSEEFWREIQEHPIPPAAHGTMLLMGVDCARDDAKISVAVGEYRAGVVDVKDVAVCTRARPAALTIAEWPHERGAHALLAVDAPLGWQEALGRSLIAHRAGESITILPNDMFRRATDRFIREHLGKTFRNCRRV